MYINFSNYSIDIPSGNNSFYYLDIDFAFFYNPSPYSSSSSILKSISPFEISAKLSFFSSLFELNFNILLFYIYYFFSKLKSSLISEPLSLSNFIDLFMFSSDKLLSNYFAYFLIASKTY